MGIENSGDITPDKGTVVDSKTFNDPRFPKVVGRTRRTVMISTIDGVTPTDDPKGSFVLDSVDARSATAMSGGE